MFKMCIIQPYLNINYFSFFTGENYFRDESKRGVEIANAISQQIHVLIEYVQHGLTETDIQIIKVKEELQYLENSLQGRIRHLESVLTFCLLIIMLVVIYRMMVFFGLATDFISNNIKRARQVRTYFRAYEVSTKKYNFSIYRLLVIIVIFFFMVENMQ